MKHQHTTPAPAQEAVSKKKPARTASKSNGDSSAQGFTFGEEREEMIRQVAYSLYEARSCQDGHSMQDWLQAEAQIDQMAAPNTQAS